MEKEKQGINKNTLDNSVLKSIISCSCGLIFAGALLAYVLRGSLPDKFLAGYLVGAIGGLANLYFLIMAIVATVNPNGVRKLKALFGALGMNISLVAIFYPAYRQWVNMLGLVAGFSLVLAVVVLGAYWAGTNKGT